MQGQYVDHSPYQKEGTGISSVSFQRVSKVSFQRESMSFQREFPRE